MAENEALVIDGRTNTISYILIMHDDGSISRRYLSDAQKAEIAKSIKLTPDGAPIVAPNVPSNSANPVSNPANRVANPVANPVANQATNQTPKKVQNIAESRRERIIQRSHIREWNKSKILYEQQVEKIFLLR